MKKIILTVLIIMFFATVNETAAQEKKIVVLFPGWGGNENQLLFLKKAFKEEEMEVLIVKITFHISLAKVADEVEKQLDGRLRGQKVVLIGFSFGGLVARQFASDYPNNIEKIIIIGTPNNGYPLMPWFMYSIGKNTKPIYIIAGNKSEAKWFLNRENDGAVDIESAFSVPPNLVRDSALFHLSHLELINSREVAQKILSWI